MPLHKYPVHLWQKLQLLQSIYAHLWAHFLRSLEKERTPTPVHYKPHRAQFKISPKNRQRKRVEDVPIPIQYPPGSQQELWGGEGLILGHRYANNGKLSRSAKLKKAWKPQLYTRELYSEILDKMFTVTMTMTLDLTDEAYGFDFYILKTPKAGLCSKFGMDLKRGMVLRFARQEPQLHPYNPERRAAIYDKYKSFVIPEAEWTGLTLEEAVEKQRLLEGLRRGVVQRLQEQVLSRPTVVQKRASDHA